MFYWKLEGNARVQIATYAYCLQLLQIRISLLLWLSTFRLGPQESQQRRKQIRQWWRLVNNKVHCTPQMVQTSESSSGCHTGSTRETTV